jgi:hypothetical protein
MPNIIEVPDEILRHIFFLGCQDHPRFKITEYGQIDNWSDWQWGADTFPRTQVSLSQVNRRLPMRFASLVATVCTRWQAIVISSSKLYFMRISLNSTAPEFPHKKDFCEQIAVLAEALRASRGSNLYVHLIIHRTCSITIRRLFYWGLTMIAGHQRQLKGLRVVCARSDHALPHIIGLLSQSTNVSSFIHHTDASQEPGNLVSLGIDQDLYSKLPLFVATASDKPVDFPHMEHLQASLTTLSTIPLPQFEFVQGLVMGDPQINWDTALQILAASRHVKLLHLAGSPSFYWPSYGVESGSPVRTKLSILLPSPRTMRLDIQASSVRGFFQRVDLPSLEHLILQLGSLGAEEAVQLSSDETHLPSEFPSLRTLQIDAGQLSDLQLLPDLRCPKPLEKLSLIVNYDRGLPLISEPSLNSLPAAQEVCIRMSTYHIQLLLLHLSHPEIIKVLRISSFSGIGYKCLLEESLRALHYRPHTLVFEFDSLSEEPQAIFIAICNSNMPSCLEIKMPRYTIDQGARWEEICRRCRVAFEGLLELTVRMPTYRSGEFHTLKPFKHIKKLTLLITLDIISFEEVNLPALDAIDWLMPGPTGVDDIPMPNLQNICISMDANWYYSLPSLTVNPHELNRLREGLNAVVESRKAFGRSLNSVIVEQTYSSANGCGARTLMVLDGDSGHMVEVTTRKPPVGKLSYDGNPRL